jgi:MG2 domain-containing protein
MSNIDKRKNARVIALAFFFMVGLFSAAILSSALSYSSTAYAQSSNASPFKGNVTGSIVSEQQDENAKAGANMSSSASYMSSYPKEGADERRPFIVHSEKHLYKPGEEVNVEGNIWVSLIDDIGGDVTTVTLNVTDNKGNMTVNQEEVEIDEDGAFSATFALPVDAELGSYSINAMIEAEASVLDTLSANIKSKLDTSARFEVVSSNAFAVKAEGKDFEVEVASNSTVDNFKFSQEEKKVSFRVEGETGTRGVAQVTLPKELLSGEMVVSIDGRVLAEDSNDVIVTSDTATEMTLEINYPHSEHTVEVTGTNVVPEFPVSMVVMAAAIASVIATISIVTRKRTSLI